MIGFHEEDLMTAFRSGYAAIVGKPNAGKSTLLNAILGEKIAIVSDKPQTTRNRLTGIKTLPDCQIVFIDTPGIHRPQHMLGEIMVRNAMESVGGVDTVIIMILPKMPVKSDLEMITEVRKQNDKCILVINKIDTVKKDMLLPVISRYTELFSFKDVIPVSALLADGVDRLLDTVKSYLPEGEMLYPDDLATDQIERFMVAEIIREKIFRNTMDEVPHSVAVEVNSWKEEPDAGLIRIGANIYVERDSQKGIIIGKNGAMLKKVGSQARKDIEDLLGIQVFISLWVKVKKNWRKDATFMKEIGLQ